MGYTALVTGASRGIGMAISRELISRGVRVFGMARHFGDVPEGLEPLRVDLLDADALGGALEDLVKDTAIDILVNNAGISVGNALEDLALVDLQRQLELNVRATVQCTQAVVPGMKTRRYGRIVNLGSRAGLGRANLSAYAASKAAIVGLTRSWALELAQDGITVNCVAPGPIETEMLAEVYPVGSKERDAILHQVAMRRFGRPEEVADAVSYFTGRRAAFTSGQTIYVCGGATAGQL